MDHRLTWLRLSMVSLALAIVLGAFGVHGLESHVTAARLATWQTAQYYHVIVSIILLILAVASDRWRVPRWSLRLLVAGGLLFSGSLYVLVLADQSWLGAITPLGGMFLIAGLFLAAIGCCRINHPPSQ